MNDKTRDQAARIRELEERLSQLEARPVRSAGWLRTLMPAEASRHFRAAGREQLLGMRALVDFWIKRFEESDAKSTSRAVREEISIE
ncbi:MAG: hypothetical protein FJ038_08670 [Chloroflexi bacterium]|nr:hypothetical protein [Chloroflexota bacterium]